MSNKNENPIEQMVQVNLLSDLRSGNSFSKVMEKIPAEDFSGRRRCVCCSDGRFEPENSEQEKTGLAGQGIIILLNLPELAQFIAAMKKDPKRPVDFASHIHCGAAKIVYGELEKMSEEAMAEVFAFLGIDALPENSDRLGEIFTERLADAVGGNYYHLHELDPEKEEHAEFGILINTIDVDVDQLLPQGQQLFKSSAARFDVSDDYLRTEWTKLTEIAFGHGKMNSHNLAYNPEDKFYLLIACQKHEAVRLERIAKEVAANPAFHNLVKVDIHMAKEEKIEE